MYKWPPYRLFERKRWSITQVTLGSAHWARLIEVEVVAWSGQGDLWSRAHSWAHRLLSGYGCRPRLTSERSAAPSHTNISRRSHLDKSQTPPDITVGKRSNCTPCLRRVREEKWGKKAGELWKVNWVFWTAARLRARLPMKRFYFFLLLIVSEIVNFLSILNRHFWTAMSDR